MEQHRWQWIPIGLVVAGVVIVCAAAGLNYAALGWWQALIYAGCAAALAAVFVFRRKLSATEVELEALRSRLDAEEERLHEERRQLEDFRCTVEQELTGQARRIDKREQALAHRLVAYREWMEFPQPLELADATAAEELSELAAKDRELMKLLKAETKVLYDSIVKNRYSPKGELLLPVVRDDLVQLITRVAQLYQPSVQQPLLETSLHQVLRAASRTSLQLLVVLDELPLGVKDASLNTLYGYVRNAVTAWRMYKSAEPYWPYVNTAYYVGRMAMGANPLALGTWWFLSSVGRQGAAALAQHVVNQQALALLSNLVRVIGYEVAATYGGDFRHRDANWIYAAELTELVSQFPLSRDSLSHALREVGMLQLRSEYDRTFLYRCIAGHKSAGPEKFQAAAVLTMEERRAVATRLERFLEAFVHGKSDDRVAHWKAGAEERLGIKLSVSLKTSVASAGDQIRDGLRSLASFLVSIKQLEPPEAVRLLEDVAIARELPADERGALLDELATTASYFFEHPDLDPDSDLVDRYLDDLAALHARTAPREAGIEESLDDVAAYLRRQPQKMRERVERQCAAALAARLPAEATPKKVPREVARAALDLLADPTEKARFLYGGATIEWPEGGKPDEFEDGAFWLLGAEDRLILFAAGSRPRVVWRAAAGEVHAQSSRQLLASGCRITGGQWLLPGGADKPLAIRLSAGIMGSYGHHFRPLLDLIGRPATVTAAVTIGDG